MRIERAHRIRTQMTSRIVDLYSKAIIYGMTSEEISKELIAITHPKSPKGIPEWVTWYCRGVSDTLSNQLYQNHLEFMYTLDDGNRYSVNRDSKRYYEKHGVTPRELHERQISNGHYWIKTGKPYFINKSK